MKEYEFVPSRATFVLKTPHVGRRWFNYLFNDVGWLAAVSHVGNGFSTLVDANGKRIQLMDPDSRALYLRDEESGACWNPAIAPLLEPVSEYCCETAMETTAISSRCGDIVAHWTLTVPSDFTGELWSLTIQNQGATHRKLNAFALIKFDLGGFPMPPYYIPHTTSVTVCDPQLRGVFCDNRNPHVPHSRCSGYLACSEAPSGMDGDLNVFCSPIGSFARPLTLLEGRDCRGSTTVASGRGAVLQNAIELHPGETKTLYYAAGLSTDIQTAMAETSAVFARAQEWFAGAERNGMKRFGSLRVETPEQRVNQIMNHWAQKQVSFCMIGKKSVRDSSQIAMGLLNFDSPLAERVLVECLEHQYEDGHAMLGWSPVLDPKLYSDPSMWLTLAICELVKERGDRGFLEKQLRFFDGRTVSVYEHLQAAVRWYTDAKNIGPNGLPLIHYADWCDALNIKDPQGESVFMAMGLCWMYRELAELCTWIGDSERAAELKTHFDRLAEQTNKVAWNGEYYVRAFSGDGIVGDRDSPVGGNIYVNPQSWSILAGVCPPERIAQVFSVIDSMDTEAGIPLCKPPYEHYYDVVGRMSGMLPGIYESGGIYNHAVGFKMMADCLHGRGDNALRSLLKVIPDSEALPSSTTDAEPYVFTNCWARHPSYFNRSRFSWMTGASAWALRSFYEGILGLRRTYEGLRVVPNLPTSWSEVHAERTFRGVTYRLHYKNSGGDTVAVSVDGTPLSNNVLPSFDDRKPHDVLIEITA